jgi:hypothetical protein
LLLRRVVLASRGGLDDTAGAMVVTRDDLLFTIRGAPGCLAAQRHALVVGAVGHAILPHVPRRTMTQWSLGGDACRVVLGSALGQLDVVRFLRRGLL